MSRIEGNTAVLGEDHAGYFDPNDSAKLAELIASATTDAASREALLSRNSAIPTCRDAAQQLKRIYSEIA